MNIKLIIDDIEIPLTMGTYKEIPQVVEERNETEAGTVHRDIARVGRTHIEVSTNADGTEKAYLDTCVCADSLTVSYYSESDGLVEKTMYIDPESYDVELLAENGDNRFYNVSFSLEEY